MEVANTPLIDRYKRYLNYLRISITDRCNLKCIYCMPSGPGYKMAHEEILRYEEILRIIRIGIRLGISKVRITGGEPLVRNDCCDFLGALTRLRGLNDISLTTNGVLLAGYIDQIASAGIKRLNISLDTLDREKYKEITGVDAFDRVWQGIEAARINGINPIKINVVALNGINDHELTDLAALSFKYPFHIRFIEYMPIGRTRLCDRAPLLYPQIRSRIERLGELLPIARQANDGPAMRYKFKGAIGEIGFISAVSQHFCNECNRLRLTADGRIRSCLLADIHEDIKTPLRAGHLDTDLAEVFFRAVKRKPFQHPVKLEPNAINGEMVRIGG